MYTLIVCVVVVALILTLYVGVSEFISTYHDTPTLTHAHVVDMHGNTGTLCCVCGDVAVGDSGLCTSSVCALDYEYALWRVSVGMDAMYIVGYTEVGPVYDVYHAADDPVWVRMRGGR
jgi:hypothetical protein